MRSVAAVHALCAAILLGSMATIAMADTSLIPAREEVVIPKTCTLDRVYKMPSYDCSSMNLREIPQNLRSNIEVSKMAAAAIQAFRALFTSKFWLISCVT